MIFKNIIFLIFILISCNAPLDNKSLKLVYNDIWIGEGIAYGPFRDGQFPGGPNPSIKELTEDLHLIEKKWNWIRVYGSRGITRDILNIIKTDNLNIKVMLGAWIGSIDSKDGILNNYEEIKEAVILANQFPDIVNSVNVGNETLVFWSDHRVPSDTLFSYISYVKNNVSIPVTTADDFNAWNKEENQKIANLVDFIVLHIHPLWGGLQIDKAVDWVKKIYLEIYSIYPNKKIVIGETGWATQKHDKGMQAELIKGKAGEIEQEIFINQFLDWTQNEKIPHFLFEVFDENWKGGNHPNEVEKHWGLYNADRTPKKYIKNHD